MNLQMYDPCNLKDIKGMHIAHLNTRSMVNKWDLIKAQFSDSKLHVISFSETSVHERLPSNLFILNSKYDFIRQDRCWSDLNATNIKKGGGLGI